MKCAEVRMHLAAYRRSDWSAEEQHAVNEHLAECAACRRWEAEARSVGDRLREMPTIVPPASLRANVFAAIRREELAAATRAAEAVPAVPVPSAPAAPEKALPSPPAPIVLPIPAGATRPARGSVATIGRVGEIAGSHRPPRVIFGTRTAIATIAALFLIMFTAHVLPLNGAARFVGPSAINAPPPPPPSITADAQYPTATSAFANKDEIFYIGQSATGQEMLIGYNRITAQSQDLFAQPTTQTLTLVALSDQMLVWLSSDGASWTLQAAPLANDTLAPLTSAPITLAYSGQSFGNSTLAHFMALSATGPSAVFTALDTHGALLLERVDLGATDASQVTYTFITEAGAGHTIMQPYVDGQTVYWVDKSIAADGATLGVIWQQVGQQAATPLAVNGSAFYPVASNGHLVWFQALPTQNANENVAAPISGTLMYRDSAAATPQTIASTPLATANVWRGPGYLMWRDDQGTIRTYRVDIHDHGSNAVQLPTSYTALGLSPTTVTWVTPPATGTTDASTIWCNEIG